MLAVGVGYGDPTPQEPLIPPFKDGKDWGAENNDNYYNYIQNAIFFESIGIINIILIF